MLWRCVAEARQQKGSDQISPITPTSSSLTLSPFKTNQKTFKKGEEKKTEPTTPDPSTAALLKNNDKVKGQSALLNMHNINTLCVHIFRGCLSDITQDIFEISQSVYQWKQHFPKSIPQFRMLLSFLLLLKLWIYVMNFFVTPGVSFSRFFFFFTV